MEKSTAERFPFIGGARAVIHTDNVISNLTAIRKLVHPAKVMAVVKADAYGHGAAVISRCIEDIADYFAVADISEAITLRSEGIKKPILILGRTPIEYIEEIVGLSLTQTVADVDYAEELSNAARFCSSRVKVHVELDTGMSRTGIRVDEGELVHGCENSFRWDTSCDINADFCEKNPYYGNRKVNKYLCNGRFVCEYTVQNAVRSVEHICSLKNLYAEGIFTHFAASDGENEEEKEFTRNQYGLFTKVVSLLEQKGISFPLVHCCNSAALWDKSKHLSMIRTGISLYGLTADGKSRLSLWEENKAIPSNDNKSLALNEEDGSAIFTEMDGFSELKEIVKSGRLSVTEGKNGFHLQLKEVMTFESTVIEVKRLLKGSRIGYGCSETLAKDSNILTVAVGYADGYPRCLSGKGIIYVRGKPLRVVGRVCMDNVMLDGGDGFFEVGDRAEIFGFGTPQSTDAFARSCDTISYEALCRVSSGVRRIFVSNGKVLDVR